MKNWKKKDSNEKKMRKKRKLKRLWVKVILAMNRIYYWLLISLVKILNKNLEKKLDIINQNGSVADYLDRKGATRRKAK